MVKFEMCTIHRITNICITAKLKIGGAYYAQVRIISETLRYMQDDHLSGKPGNVREFETCQGNVTDVVNSQGIVREKNLVMEKCPKTVHY